MQHISALITSAIPIGESVQAFRWEYIFLLETSGAYLVRSFL